MKSIILSALVLSGMAVHAQDKKGMVGINTDEPRATLHIEPGVSESNGLIIPRITAAQMVSMSSLPHFGADHHAIITYLKETLPTADRTGKLVDVADPGYYYYDNTTGVQKWKTFGGGEQDLRMVGLNHLTQDAGTGSNGTDAGAGFSNIGIGRNTYSLNNSSGTNTGYNNIAIGGSAISAKNITGSGNIALGHRIMEIGGDITGWNNIAIGGVWTMSANPGGSGVGLSGNNNIALGVRAMEANGNISGNSNIALGNWALFSNSNLSGNNNIALGEYAMTLINGNNGSGNIAIGTRALALSSTSPLGNKNIGIGSNTGQWMEGNGNIQIGNNDLPTYTGALDNVVAIGNGINLNMYGSSDNVILLGIESWLPNSPRVGMGTYQPQAKLDVAGGVRVGGDNNPCTYNNKGTIRFDNGTNKFQGCDGTSWVNLH